MPKGPQPCQLKDCKNKLGPGACRVGYDIDGVTHNIKVCESCSRIILAGGVNITADRQLKPVSSTFFIKKGTP